MALGAGPRRGRRTGPKPRIAQASRLGLGVGEQRAATRGPVVCRPSPSPAPSVVVPPTERPAQGLMGRTYQAGVSGPFAWVPIPHQTRLS